MNISKNAKIAESAKIISSVIEEDVIIEEDVVIGPFAYIRKGSIIRRGAHIGNCVEIKNSEIGENTYIAHMSYVGDSVIGNNCNIGAGVKFANYNGRKKQKTVVGNNVFIGCNSVIVAPANIADNTYIAALTLFKGNSNENTLYYEKREMIEDEIFKDMYIPDNSKKDNNIVK